MAKDWAKRWDEILSNCSQEDYSLLLKVSQFVDGDCWRFQSFRSFLDDSEEAEQAERFLELFDE